MLRAPLMAGATGVLGGWHDGAAALPIAGNDDGDGGSGRRADRAAGSPPARTADRVQPKTRRDFHERLVAQLAAFVRTTPHRTSSGDQSVAHPAGLQQLRSTGG